MHLAKAFPDLLNPSARRQFLLSSSCGVVICEKKGNDYSSQQIGLVVHLVLWKKSKKSNPLVSASSSLQWSYAEILPSSGVKIFLFHDVEISHFCSVSVLVDFLAVLCKWESCVFTRFPVQWPEPARQYWSRSSRRCVNSTPAAESRSNTWQTVPSSARIFHRIVSSTCSSVLVLLSCFAICVFWHIHLSFTCNFTPHKGYPSPIPREQEIFSSSFISSNKFLSEYDVGGAKASLFFQPQQAQCRICDPFCAFLHT